MLQHKIILAATALLLLQACKPRTPEQLGAALGEKYCKCLDEPASDDRVLRCKELVQPEMDSLTFALYTDTTQQHGLSRARKAFAETTQPCVQRIEGGN